MILNRSLMGVAGVGMGQALPYMPKRPPASPGSVALTLWCYTGGYFTDACKVERSLDQDSDANDFGIQLPPPPKLPALDPLTDDYQAVLAQMKLDYEKQLADWARKSIEESQIGQGGPVPTPFSFGDLFGFPDLTIPWYVWVGIGVSGIILLKRA